MSEPTGNDRRQIAQLQERAARAIPAAVEQQTDGCWLRHSDSAATWWAGATLMHGPTSAPSLDDRIAAVEAFYAPHGEPARFQICPACPANLDDALSRRGYALQDLVSLQVRTQPPQPTNWPGPATKAVLQNVPDAGWFAIWMATAGPQADAEAEWRLLQRVKLPSRYVTVSINDRPVSVGRAVADTGWTGIFNMATLPEARGKGAASAVLTALADWTADQNASQMYLQVERDNPAALAIYRRAGFHELCTYHYRTASSLLTHHVDDAVYQASA